MNALELIELSPVMPVIVVRDPDTAVDLARSLVAGGIRTLEITLRSAAALEAITAIQSQVPDAVVGVGTVRTPQQLDAALRAGARFAISPGLTEELAGAARASGIPFLPGVATASEAMRAAELGFLVQKLFPAEAVGQKIKFCPTGGIHAGNAAQYLALPNVGCIGGSWLTPAAAIEARQWDAITALAREACALAAG
jgi:2-dehydro-3-deoxyphosphogluconate aldolase/(4S)-4-hydroxy-2-oxoglutarate aldolase